MPFGGVLFADIKFQTDNEAPSRKSPVPFGGVLFADRPSIGLTGWRADGVTSAFRRSAVRGRLAIVRK